MNSFTLKTMAAGRNCELVAGAAVEFFHPGPLPGRRLSPTHLADLLPGNLINRVPPAAGALPHGQLWETLLELNTCSRENGKFGHCAC